uniref:DM2 domain-containing protein n=1 Tax=viral metagenome TaxID=1070528 RepID=A0A6C0BR98_9ZZZZ
MPPKRVKKIAELDSKIVDTQPKDVKKSVKKTVSNKQPVTVEETKPVAVEETKPVAVEETKPVAVEETKPVTVEEIKPVTVEEIKQEPEPEPVEDTKSDTDIKSDKSETEKNAFITKLNLFTSKVAAINREVRELQTIGRTLEKDFTQVIRAISKQKSKNRINTENRPLSGFAMPSLLSKELYSFLSIEEGTRIPRKDVTRMLNEYIKRNDLRNEKDKRHIIPDAALTKIFGCKESDTVTYFNLQTYMKHHFIKEIKQPTTTFEPIAV